MNERTDDLCSDDMFVIGCSITGFLHPFFGKEALL
jgi:hypothetical protein